MNNSPAQWFIVFLCRAAAFTEKQLFNLALSRLVTTLSRYLNRFSIRQHFWTSPFLTSKCSCRWSCPLKRATGCRRRWAALWRCTSWCCTAGRRRGVTGPSSPTSCPSWINWSATPAACCPWWRTFRGTALSVSIPVKAVEGHLSGGDQGACFLSRNLLSPWTGQ